MANLIMKFSSYLELDSILFNFVVNILPDSLFVNAHLRPAIARMMGLKCGPGCQIRKGVYFETPRRMALGKNILLNRQSYFDAGGGIIIEDNVKFGPQTMLISGTHRIGGPGMRMGDMKPGRIRIGLGSWIGARVTITAGVSIGAGSVISAGSVVQRSVPPNFVVAGNPARAVMTLDGAAPEPGRES